MYSTGLAMTVRDRNNFEKYGTIDPAELVEKKREAHNAKRRERSKQGRSTEEGRLATNERERRRYDEVKRLRQEESEETELRKWQDTSAKREQMTSFWLSSLLEAQHQGEHACFVLPTILERFTTSDVKSLELHPHMVKLVEPTQGLKTICVNEAGWLYSASGAEEFGHLDEEFACVMEHPERAPPSLATSGEAAFAVDMDGWVFIDLLYKRKPLCSCKTSESFPMHWEFVLWDLRKVLFPSLDELVSFSHEVEAKQNTMPQIDLLFRERHGRMAGTLAQLCADLEDKLPGRSKSVYVADGPPLTKFTDVDPFFRIPECFKLWIETGEDEDRSQSRHQEQVAEAAFQPAPEEDEEDDLDSRMRAEFLKRYYSSRNVVVAEEAPSEGELSRVRAGEDEEEEEDYDLN